jgi:uridine kinase
VTAARALIAVDGLDGSGKSTFAQQVVAALASDGLVAALFRVDDFRRPVDWARAGPRPTEADLYYDEYYDLDGLERALQAFAAGATSVTIPRFDPATEGLDGARELPLAGASVAVVEGVFALRVPSAAAGLVIYLEVDRAEARRRIIERDLRKGRSREAIQHRIDARYFPAQDRYHAAFDPCGRAAVVLDNRALGAPRIRRRDLAALAALPAAPRAALDRLLSGLSP